MQRIVNFCEIHECYDMNIDIEYILDQPLTLCQAHGEMYKNILEDIQLTEDVEWMREWARENLKEEAKIRWD